MLPAACCSFPSVSSVQMVSPENWGQDFGVQERFCLDVPCVSLGLTSVFFRGAMHGEWGFRYFKKLNKERVLVEGWNEEHSAMEKNEITIEEKCHIWPVTSDIKAVQRCNLTWKSGAKRIDIFHESRVENESL